MSNMSIDKIVQTLQNTNSKVQLIYAFNGTGKTRLSIKFKELIDSNEEDKILYYNAFTEDLFYWDNDRDNPKLKYHNNKFMNWLLVEQGFEDAILHNFENFLGRRLNARFDTANYEFGFTISNDTGTKYIKISRGEESCFIWSIFYTLICHIIDNDEKYSQLQYIFIDDPVSSLDENHLIKSAVFLAQIIKSSKSNLKFIVTTHNALFYNVLYEALKNKKCYILDNLKDGTFHLQEKGGDSDQSFFYHLHIKKIIEDAVKENRVERYHFMLLRNLYEKTSQFLGYGGKWSQLLPDEANASYEARIMNFYSHNTLSDFAISEPSPEEKKMVGFLIDNLNNRVFSTKQ